MIPVDGESQRLRELHELYIWQVNAAVEEGRDDLVAELADEYLEAALAELAAGRPAVTGPTGADVEPTDLEPTGSDVEPTQSTGSTQPTGPADAWDVLDCRPTGRSWWRRLLRH